MPSHKRSRMRRYSPRSSSASGSNLKYRRRRPPSSGGAVSKWEESSPFFSSRLVVTRTAAGGTLCSVRSSNSTTIGTEYDSDPRRKMASRISCSHGPVLA